MSSRIATLARSSLALLAGAIVISKIEVLLFGDPTFGIAAASATNAALVVALVLRRDTVACILAIGFVIGASLYHYLWPDQACGCLPFTVRQARSVAVLYSAAMGVLGLLLWDRRNPTLGAGHHPTRP